MDQDIFISYSRKDTMIAERICAALDRVGITYFIDRQGIAGGMEFPEVLADAITDCKIFLFLASENSYVSKFTNSEITFAFNEKQPNSILPYIIDGSQLPKKMRFIFSGINWRTIEQHPIDSVLVNDLLQLLGREAANTPRRPTRVPGGLGSDSGTVDVGGGTTSMTQAEIDKTKGAADALYNQKKYSEAYNLYLKAADAGDYWCQFRVAWMANNAEGVTKNVDTARKYYTMSANQGYNYAQYNLGVIYEEEKNYAEAYKWYRKAAAQDHDSAMYWLGVLLRDGKGCAKDEKEAISWFMKLADKGDGRGFNALGNAYYNGTGVAVDYNKAVDYYRRGYEAGNIYATSNLGMCYEYGNGVVKDLDMARKYYKEAADKGNKYAKEQYDRLSKSSSTSSTSSTTTNSTTMSKSSVDELVKLADKLYDAAKYSEAVPKYRKAADAGSSWAQFRIGWMANNAEGMSKDPETARKYYMMSAQQGYRYAQYNLAVIYDAEKNYAESYKWYRKAAEQDHESAMYWLGVALKDGNGCVKDEKEAHSWFMKLAAKNDKRALAAVGDDYYYGRGVEVDFPKSVEYYRKAADLGHVYSQYSLGYAYERGKGVTANLDEAKRWYRKAADGGNESARKALEKLKSGNASDPLSTMTEGQLIDKANSLYNAKDYAEAYRYYQASVDRFPNASVWLRMGVMCEDGLGVPVDINKAKRFYELAGEKNNAQAWVYLGHLYYNGKISKDYSLAEKYYQKADALGDAAGAAWTGVLYHYALGRPADKAKARQYYDKAISRGSKFAEEQKAKL